MKGIMKFGIMALFLVSLVGSAFAFHGGVFSNDDAKEAIDSDDYDAWKEAMISELTEERFNLMRERHAQMEVKISERKAMMEERNSVISTACEEDDISKISEIDCPMHNTINEANFEAFCELHQAKQDRDFDKIKELSEELGFEGLGSGFGMKGMHRMGMRQGFAID